MRSNLSAKIIIIHEIRLLRQSEIPEISHQPPPPLSENLASRNADPTQIWQFRTHICTNTSSARENSAPGHIYQTVAHFQAHKSPGPDLTAKINLVLGYQTVPKSYHNVPYQEDFPYKNIDSDLHTSFSTTTRTK